MQKASSDLPGRSGPCSARFAQAVALSACLLVPWALPTLAHAQAQPQPQPQAQAQAQAQAQPRVQAPNQTASPALAAPTVLMASPAAADPALEARVLAVAEELRCLVCQNETIAASSADLAVDLRRQIRQQLLQGRTEAQILEFMVQRYGDFVLYRPPLKASTLLLWLGPFALLVVGLGALALQIRQRRALPGADQVHPPHAHSHTPPGHAPGSLSDAERRLAERLLGESLERP